MPTENKDQRTLREWLTAGLAIPGVVDLRGDAGYLLNNMIAKYTLAADSYIVSNEALIEFGRQGVDLSATYKRSRFYGKPKPFIYEHAVPAGVVREALLSGDRNEAGVLNVLQGAGFVAVLTRIENARIKESGFDRKMPSGWVIGDNPRARYDEVGVSLSSQHLFVCGAICR